MNELVDWLRAQIDEDERLAREAAGHANGSEVWDLVSFVGGDLDPGKHFSLSIGGRALNASSGDAPDDDTPVVAAELRHMANFDPARVLAEVESRRRILDLYEAMRAGVDAADGTLLAGAAKVRLGAYGNVLKCLALPYQSHPLYRESWRP